MIQLRAQYLAMNHPPAKDDIGRQLKLRGSDDAFSRSETSQELRMLSLSQAIYDHQVILNNVVLNCQQYNQCLKCQVSGHKNCHQKLAKKFEVKNC